MIDYQTIKWKINLESVIFDTTCHKCWSSSQKHSLGPILCSRIIWCLIWQVKTKFLVKIPKNHLKNTRKCNTHRFPTYQFHDNSITFESVISKFKSRWTRAKERTLRIYTTSRTVAVVYAQCMVFQVINS